MTPEEKSIIEALMAGRVNPAMMTPQPQQMQPRQTMPQPQQKPILSPQGFQSYQEGRLGADQTFAPGPGVRVAQNEATNDADPIPSINDIAAAGAGIIDPAQLEGLDLNSTEAKNLVWALRMLQAEPTIRQYAESEGTRIGPRMLEMIPGETIENQFFSPEYRQYKNAREAFANAALRADTGAQINASEIPRVVGETMPKPGDDPETLKRKQAQREVWLRGIIAATGDAKGLLPQVGTPVLPIDDMSDDEFEAWLGTQ